MIRVFYLLSLNVISFLAIYLLTRLFMNVRFNRLDYFFLIVILILGMLSVMYYLKVRRDKRP